MNQHRDGADTEYERQWRRQRRSGTAGMVAAALTASVTLHWLTREAMWANAARTGVDVGPEDFDKPSQLFWSLIIALVVAAVAGTRAHADLSPPPYGKATRIQLGSTLAMPVIGGVVTYGILFFMFFNTRDSVFV